MINLTINGREIGPGLSTYAIAEMSANHNQSFEEAAALIRLAKDAGADAIKLQTYTADALTIDCDKDYFRIGKGTIWEGMTLYELYQQAYMPWDWQPDLVRIANELELDVFSTPFDETAVDFLEELEVPAYKIASFEIIDHGLISKVAATGKPMIMSTGMASLSEIADSVSVARSSGAEQIALLKCTSSYPAVPTEMDLQTIPFLQRAFDLPTGLSDHTLGISVPVAATVLGGCIVEKHFTSSRDKGGPDSKFSLEPHEWREMVDAIRVAEQAIGKVNFELTSSEKNSVVFRRSLFVVNDVKEGDVFSHHNVRSIRPGYGLPPKYLDTCLGKKATCDIERGTPLCWSHVTNS